MKKNTGNSGLDLRLPTAIVGTGLTGNAVLRMLLACGISRDEIFTFDHKDPEADCEQPDQLWAKNPQSLIISPGVPLAQEWIQTFKSTGGQITSELTLATSLFTTEKFVGVTGSIGKSTCTALLQAGLARFSPDSFVGGNLGYPLADYITKKQSGGPTAEWVVLELSSYQLENFKNLSACGSLLTYMTPNHMERYSGLQDYYQTKWFLVERTCGPVVLNRHGGDLLSFAANRIGPKQIWASPQDSEFKDLDFSKACLVGQHNADNLASVLKLSRALGWPISAEKGFFEFPGLPHRLENLGIHHGVQWINDSKATTIESALQAARSTTGLTQGTMHLLLGGKDKNLPWQDLKELAAPGRRFYFFGEVRTRARTESGLPGEEFSQLRAAIQAAKTNAISGDLILLSPGGTSLDEFRSFEARGDFFRTQI